MHRMHFKRQKLKFSGNRRRSASPKIKFTVFLYQIIPRWAAPQDEERGKSRSVIQNKTCVALFLNTLRRRYQIPGLVLQGTWSSRPILSSFAVFSIRVLYKNVWYSRSTSALSVLCSAGTCLCFSSYMQQGGADLKCDWNLAVSTVCIHQESYLVVSKVVYVLFWP